MDSKILQQLGLNTNETKVYLALLEMHHGSAGELIKKTKLHRGVVYDNLEKLSEKGLLSFIQEDNRRIYHIGRVEQITEFVEKEEKKLKQKKEAAKQLQGFIQKQEAKHPQEQQEATIFRGKIGVKIALRELVALKKDWISFGGAKESNTVMGEKFWRKVAINFTKNKKNSKLLFNESLRYWGDQQKKMSKQIKIRYFPKTMEPLAETIVCGNKTVIIAWDEQPIVTIITNKKIADANRNYFETIWKNAKR